MTIDELDTPCLIVDLDRMEANIRRWQTMIAATGTRLRPHVKTHKVPAIAKLQLQAGAAGITVAKVAEAEVFAAAGCNDIFIAYPLIGAEKWRRVAALAGTCTLTVGAESEVGLRGLSDAAQTIGSTVRVRIEIDLGMNRSGVQPDYAADLCERALNLPGIELDGIFAFRGTSFPGAEGRTAAEIGREEGELMAALAEQLRSDGIPIHAVSAGSTPTAHGAAQAPGVTEVRPGTYIFGDYMMAERGGVAYSDVALAILCTVVSRPAGDKATIDGGSKTFCGDINPARLGLPGYARAADLDAYVELMSEEHGVLRLGPDAQPRIGDRLAFYPIHVCTAVNLSDELVGVRGDRVEQVWPVLARGKRT
jgi:D-serine deaminase-like pyridoxal phosphate-dependent protein